MIGFSFILLVTKAIISGDKNAEVEAVVQVGSIKIIVTNKKKTYHYISDFTNLDLDPKNTDILMVKIGYLVPELYDIGRLGYGNTW